MDATARARRIHGELIHKTFSHSSFTDLYTLFQLAATRCRHVLLVSVQSRSQHKVFLALDLAIISTCLSALVLFLLASLHRRLISVNRVRLVSCSCIFCKLQVPLILTYSSSSSSPLQLPIEAPHSTMTNRCSRSSFSISPFFASVGYSLPSNLPARRQCNELQQ